MMIIPYTIKQQDTVQVGNIVSKDSVGLKSDSASIIKTFQSHVSVINKSALAPGTAGIDFTDTTSVCGRNSIADITFFDSDNLIKKIEPDSYNSFPFIFIEKNVQIQAEARESLLKHLKPGKDIPVQPLHEDWIIVIILITAFSFSLIRTTSKSMLPGVTRFFLFKEISDPSSRDVDGLFHRKSTMLNFISFLIIGLFAYYAATYYDLIPSGIRGIIFWLISMGIIISAVTLRHIVCIITGYASGEMEVFREYLHGIYLSYRFSALLIFVLIILMSYTLLFPARVYVISGIIVMGIFYLIRVTRLMIIFLNRNISIFYLVLYLCALEILPVLISVKYFTGVF